MNNATIIDWQKQKKTIQNVRQYMKDIQIVFSKLEDNLSILGTCIHSEKYLIKLITDELIKWKFVWYQIVLSKLEANLSIYCQIGSPSVYHGNLYPYWKKCFWKIFDHAHNRWVNQKEVRLISDNHTKWKTICSQMKSRSFWWKMIW